MIVIEIWPYLILTEALLVISEFGQHSNIDINKVQVLHWYKLLINANCPVKFESSLVRKHWYEYTLLKTLEIYYQNKMLANKIYNSFQLNIEDINSN